MTQFESPTQRPVGRHELEKHFSGAVNWLDRNLDFFSPWNAEGLSMDGLQATAELAVLWSKIMTTRPVCNAFEGDLGGTMRRWHTHLIEAIGRSEVVELAMKRPVQAFPYLLPYLVLRAHGHRHEFVETSISRLYAVGFLNNQEVVPYRALDVAYFTSKAGLAPPDDPENLARSTFLFKTKRRLYIDHELAYAITHTIFYLTDFGHKTSEIIEANIANVRNILLSLIVHHVRSGHFDILGELLACWFFCNSPDNEIVRRANRTFLAQHVHDGAVAGRREVMVDLLAGSAESTREQLFGTCYHTTIVSLLLTAHLLEESEECEASNSL